MILYGESIGSYPSIIMGTKREFAGLVLHSAVATGCRAVCSCWRLPCDTLNNLENIQYLKSNAVGISRLAFTISLLCRTVSSTSRTCSANDFCSTLADFPVLFLHGTMDALVPCDHAQELYSRCESAVEPLWLEGYTHNDLEESELFEPRLQKFIREEVPRLDHSATTTSL